MPFTKFAALAGALSFASSVAAHGRVTGLVADGVYFQGFLQSFQYMQDPPAVAGWPVTYEDTGFVGPTEYTDADIICHKGATPGKAYAKVAAGGSIDLQWTAWPVSHHGPVIDYLANCEGDCTTVDKEALKFFKIDGKGLNSYPASPGEWASDDLIANNNTWTVKIPSDIAPGNYVLRHEIIALHSAYDANGAQNYPQCFNLEVTGSGSAKPAGIAATEFYTPTDPGILINIYNGLSSYEVPGPELFSGGSSAPSQTSGAVSTPSSSAPTNTPAAGESSTSAAAPVSTSAPAVTSRPATPTGIIPPYTNGTFPSSTTTKKTSCKSKSKTRKPTSTMATALPATVTEITITTATVIPVPESPSAANTPSSPSAPPAQSAPSAPTPTKQPEQPEQQPEESASLPEGTKLSAVLKWISNFYAKNGDGEYVPNNAAHKRRHARHLMS